MRATLVQLGHTAHRVPSTDAFAVGSSQCPSAAAGSHSFRVCCAVDAFIALGGRSDKSGEISTEKLRAVIKDFGLTIDIDVSATVLAPQACSRCLSPDSQTRPCCRIAAPDSRHGHGSLRIDRLRGVQTDDGGQEEVKCGHSCYYSYNFRRNQGPSAASHSYLISISHICKVREQYSRLLSKAPPDAEIRAGTRPRRPPPTRGRCCRGCIVYSAV